MNQMAKKSKSSAKKKPSRGRPSTITEAVKKQFLAFLKLGNYRSVAAKLCGVSLNSINRFAWKDGKENREFRDDIEKAEAQAEAIAVGKLVEKVKVGDMKAIEFFLARKFTERWGNNAELLRDMNRIITRLEQRIGNGGKMGNPDGGKSTKE